MITNQIQAIQAAARILGTQAALARALGVTPVTVGQWLKPDVRTGREVPPKQCVRIEQLTQGAVTRRDLRPKDWLEYWPELESIAQPAVEPVAMKTPENAPVDAPDEDQAVIVAVLIAAPKAESAHQSDHRAIPTRRTEIPSPYDHSDIDRRDEEGHGRRAANGDAVDVVAKGV